MTKKETKTSPETKSELWEDEQFAEEYNEFFYDRRRHRYFYLSYEDANGYVGNVDD